MKIIKLFTKLKELLLLYIVTELYITCTDIMCIICTDDEVLTYVPCLKTAHLHDRVCVFDC